MSATKETLKLIERAKDKAIMILIGDGHKLDEFYINDTNKFSQTLCSMLDRINEEVDVNKFKDLCVLDFEAVYMLMNQYKMLTPDIENLKDFNVRYVHYLNSLNAELDILQ